MGVSAVVSAVVVSYNSRGCLGRCLEALATEGARVIVVDNASTDGSVEFVRSGFPAVELLALSENAGYGAAANRGVALADGPAVLLLNADAWPVAGALVQLVASVEQDPRLGIAAPRLQNEDGSAQRSVFGYPRSASALASWVAAPRLVSGVFQRWRGLQSLLARRDAGSARLQPIVGEDFPAGAALLVRKEAWEEAGGFDETFFMYSEETDLCLRLRRLGWRIVLCPTSVFVHLGGASTAGVSGEMEREQLRSYLRFFAKHRGFAEAERSRRLVARALRVRALAVRGDERVEQRELAAWLGDTTLEALLR